MTAERTVLLRGWPGTGDWSPPHPLNGRFPGLRRRPAIYLFAAAKSDTCPEAFGLGAAIVSLGPSILCGCLIVPDGTHPQVLARLTTWAATHPLATAAGTRPWHVVTVSAFYDPLATVEKDPAAPWAFQPNAYSGRAPVVGADLGRTFGLSAEHCAVRSGKHRESWAVWLPGWGREHDRGRWKRRSPNRPCLYVTARRVGWQVEFGPCDKGFGKRDGGRVWRGAFLDVQSVAYALDADRGASFAEHCDAFGIDAGPLPLAVRADEQGAEQVTAALDAIRRLALALDDEAGRWFTSPKDRREGIRRFDLSRTVSPGAMAAHVLARFALRAPLETFGLTVAEQRGWAETFHGGWCEMDRHLSGLPFPAVAADVCSCYPLVAHLLGWWPLMRASRIVRRGVTRQLRVLCRQAAHDPTVALDPAVWERFGVTLVEVDPDFERFVVAVDDELRPDGRTEVAKVSAQGRTMFYAWPDVVAAAVLTGRAPKIVGAVRYVPGDPQPTMRRRLPLVAGVVLDANEDPAVAMVRARRRAKARGEARLAAELRVVANSLVYGVPSRFDDVWHRKGRDQWERGEKPGPWSCLPVGSSVAAGARLLLAVAERMVTDPGGIVAYRDTDSLLIPATPDGGGTLTLPDGSTVTALSFAQIDEVLGAFAPLAPGDDWPVWQTERGQPEKPLRAVVFGPKRHAERAGERRVHRDDGADAEEGDDAWALDDMTEANLGSTFADPPTMPGRGQSGFRRWSEAAVAGEVERAEAEAAGMRWAWRPAPWDEVDGEPFPALRRFSVRTPAMAKALPPDLGARPGTRYLVAERRWRDEQRVPVTLDPGGDLAGWSGLPWIDKRTGQAVRVSTDALDGDAIQLVSLADKAGDWSRPSRLAPVESVVVTPSNVRYRGRVSGVIDADASGMPGDLRSYRPTYANRCPIDGRPVRRADDTYCSDRCRWASQKRRERGAAAMRPQPCAREGCSGVVTRARARCCSPRCTKLVADSAYRERRRAKAKPTVPAGDRRSKAPMEPDPFAEDACPACDAVLLGSAGSGPCPVCGHVRGQAS